MDEFITIGAMAWFNEVDGMVQLLIDPILFNDSMDFWAINPYRFDGICSDSMVFLAINPKRFESINRQLRVFLIFVTWPLMNWLAIKMF